MKNNKMKWYDWILLVFQFIMLLFMLANSIVCIYAFWMPEIPNDLELWIKTIVIISVTSFVYYVFFKYFFIIKINKTSDD